MSASSRRPLPPDTPDWERRLVRAAGRGDRRAQDRLLTLCEPLVARATRGWFVPGGDRDDLAQAGRLAVLNAARAWNASGRVPFRAFARIVVERELQTVLSAARAKKHEILTEAYSLQRPVDPNPIYAYDGCAPLLFDATATVHATRADDDPVAKVIAREELNEILARASTLSRFERRALALSGSGHSHRQIAEALGTRPRGVNNALQRARRKLIPA